MTTVAATESAPPSDSVRPLSRNVCILIDIRASMLDISNAACGVIHMIDELKQQWRDYVL